MNGEGDDEWVGMRIPPHPHSLKKGMIKHWGGRIRKGVVLTKINCKISLVFFIKFYEVGK